MDTPLDQQIVNRVRAEYLEMPGMKLTVEQVQRLCGIDASVCRIVLDFLVDARFLRVDHNGTYVRCTDGTVRLHPLRAGLRSSLPSRSRRAS
jgi:hypothetical protein